MATDLGSTAAAEDQAAIFQHPIKVEFVLVSQHEMMRRALRRLFMSRITGDAQSTEFV